MRFIFKTDYGQDIKLAKHGGHVFWYTALMLLLMVAPWLVAEYWLAQLTFVLIYAIAGLGLMLLAGFTGLFSLGHAAFLGVGAYTQAVLTNAGMPFPIALACAAGVGVFASTKPSSHQCRLAIAGRRNDGHDPITHGQGRNRLPRNRGRRQVRGAPSTTAWEDAEAKWGQRNLALGWVMPSDTQKAQEDAVSCLKSGRPESRQRHTATDRLATQLDRHVEGDRRRV